MKNLGMKKPEELTSDIANIICRQRDTDLIGLGALDGHETAGSAECTEVDRAFIGYVWILCRS